MVGTNYIQRWLEFVVGICNWFYSWGSWDLLLEFGICSHLQAQLHPQIPTVPATSQVTCDRESSSENELDQILSKKQRLCLPLSFVSFWGTDS